MVETLISLSNSMGILFLRKSRCEVCGDNIGKLACNFLQIERNSFLMGLLLWIYCDSCKTKIGLRNILCSIKKEQKGWWKRLLKSEEKPAPYIKVDWNKWCDEDDEESDSNLVSDDDCVNAGEEDESSDDEGMLYLPDLEKARGT
ncbi:uncharacterized protein At3g03773 isoform X2 [Olea europaea var. sylvestris]|uniref:uncharacterized protein At3g03773 isoform X2 n=1 Tax=Olea europaea var. sylvestris TaxID=158386 RepID=UPI000C1D358D|nr:uncharacterized protein At3g03773 isoform X2 [Olea europaea var. sylvestris]